MELLLNDEQKLLQDSAATFVERHAGPKRARELRGTAAGFDRGTWAEVAGAGWLGVIVPEDSGGLGLGMTELSLIMEQAGRGLLSAPICAASVAARAIAEGDNAALRDGLLGDVMDGGKIVVPALQETARAVDLDASATRAEADGDGFRLSGRKAFIPSAAGADGFLVAADGPSGMILCHVARDADGATLDITDTVDGGGFGALGLDATPVARDQIVAGANRARAVADGIHDGMLLGLGAELLGVMGQALDTALDYLKVREQFGKPIGSFQALQHRAVNDYTEVELTRSLLFQVCAAADEGRDTPAMAAAVKAKSSAAALTVTKSAIQMHGAIGFTDEHDIGLYLKRAMALSAQYGNEAAQRGRFARLAGIEPAA